MNKNNYLKTFFFVLLAWTFQPVFAENVSFKFSFNTNNIQQGDLFTSTESFNTLWQDWKNSKGGSLNGMFDPITYGFNYELELRIPIFSGFALNFGGSRLKSTGEGTIDFEQTGGIQSETHFLKNTIRVYPFKIGFSYMFRLPFSPIYPSASAVEGSLSSASIKPLKDTNLIFQGMERNLITGTRGQTLTIQRLLDSMRGHTGI